MKADDAEDEIERCIESFKNSRNNIVFDIMPGPVKIAAHKRRRHQPIRHCPLLKSCRHMVTIQYFRRICNTGAYPTCRHYSKRMNQLKTPLQWLQKLAVEKAKMDAQAKTASSSARTI